ncbi:MAG: hypothetical protein IJ411_02340 [Oscillospiraceae bacterium]|nr:hypothetical protein [Oscillospiraceae bacterium]
MENKELLEQIQASLEKQNRFAKWQCILTAIVVVCCVGVIWMVNSVLPQLQALSVQAETTLTNLQGITEQLAQTDLQGMVHNVDQLVNSSQSAVEQTMTKMNSLDLDTLNKAIKDLAAVIEPMAKFFGMFS